MQSFTRSISLVCLCLLLYPIIDNAVTVKSSFASSCNCSPAKAFLTFCNGSTQCICGASVWVAACSFVDVSERIGANGKNMTLR